ncbi:MAG: hypothetical protein HQK75_13900 [Candidatus Magnetomorum sp.]|nr:hypothetical protein [Candidatus Magnetomorum sp.]
MAQIDKIKAKIDWLKDILKILIAVLIATCAGICKLYLNNIFNELFYIGILIINILCFLIPMFVEKINTLIKKIGDL